MVEGLRIPFDIPGNAEEQFNAIEAAVKRVTDAIRELNATVTAKAPDRELAEQSKRAARAVKNKADRIRQSSNVIKQQADDTNKLAEAELKLAREIKQTIK